MDVVKGGEGGKLLLSVFARPTSTIRPQRQCHPLLGIKHTSPRHMPPAKTHKTKSSVARDFFEDEAACSGSSRGWQLQQHASSGARLIAASSL